MRFHRGDGLSLAAWIATTAGTVAVYDRLPEVMATHFDAHGTPNGFMPRAMGAFFMPVFSLVLWAVTRLAPKILPQADKKRLTEDALAWVAALTTAFMGAVHGLLLWFALSPGANITQPVIVLMGLMWIVLGLMLPRFRRNPIVGVRTPWTLTSDENWAKTQRFAGYSMVVGGVVGGLVALSGGATATWIAFAVFMASALLPAVYSLLVARRADG